MAKPIIKFSAVAYQVGTGEQTKTGYRPQLEAQNGLYDLDFCKEVVTEKRLSMSADELLHAMEMVGEVGPAKVASDGRPRGITKLLKFNRYAQGNLDSPTSAWNDTCKAVIRPQLLADATKEIDATFASSPGRTRSDSASSSRRNSVRTADGSAKRTQPARAAECSVAAVLRTRFLSGPWSASRRLEAARRRGDEAEARRMETLLGALVDEAAGR